MDKVGGSALPDGVMMVRGNRAGVAVYDREGRLREDSFRTVKNPVKIPVLRAFGSLYASTATSARAYVRAFRLRNAGAKDFGLGELAGFCGILGGNTGLSALKVQIEGLIKAALREKAAAREPLLSLTDTFFDILSVVLVFETPTGKRLRGFHGAEHKVIAAAEKAGRAPTLEEARNASRFHPRCGTSLSAASMAIYTVSSGVLLPLVPEKAREPARLALLLASLAVAYEGMAAGKNGPLQKLGLAAQRFTTREPDEEMLRAALSAWKLAAAGEREEKPAGRIPAGNREVLAF
ncbi:MAG: DUF1385 domain-containing protein [Clostridia bacterium]|nr:DUF1385 domain-containing protein [Clostridia bacterium]